MKTSTFILSYIITFIIIVTLCVAGAIYQQKKDAQFYNNGIHSIDGASGFTKTRAEDMEVIILLNVQNVVNL